MVDLYEGLMTTRAMRRFTDEPVSEEAVLACLRAAVQAPGGGNIQPYQFLVVTDASLRRALGEIYLRAWNRYEPAVAAVTPPARDEGAARRHQRNVQASDELAHSLGDVPVHVLVLMPKILMVVSDDQGEMDVGPTYASVYPAVQNFMLAARARGLGTVLTTVYRVYEDEVRELLGIPDRYEVVALLPLGHPRGRWGWRRAARPSRSPAGTASGSVGLRQATTRRPRRARRRARVRARRGPRRRLHARRVAGTTAGPGVRQRHVRASKEHGRPAARPKDL
jgi:nitroreductase